eukprot:6461634-Amphidinium_carterae.1
MQVEEESQFPRRGRNYRCFRQWWHGRPIVGAVLGCPWHVPSHRGSSISAGRGDPPWCGLRFSGHSPSVEISQQAHYCCGSTQWPCVRDSDWPARARQGLCAIDGHRLQRRNKRSEGSTHSGSHEGAHCCARPLGYWTHSGVRHERGWDRSVARHPQEDGVQSGLRSQEPHMGDCFENGRYKGCSAKASGTGSSVANASFSEAGEPAVRPSVTTDDDARGADGEESDPGAPPAPTRARHGPQEPSAAERDQHACSGHYPFRSWCRHCVAGRGRHDGHPKRAGGTDIPVLGIDYCYLEGKAVSDVVEPPAPILVMRDSHSKATMAEVLPQKGTGHKYCGTALVNMVLRLGYTKVIIRSDCEPAIMDLRNQVASSLRALNVVVSLEDAPDSQQNGLAESACRDVKAQSRVLAHAIRENHCMDLHQRHPILPWLVMEAASSMTRGQIGPDGRTPFERLRGSPYRKALPPFGEVVQARDGSKESRIHDRWVKGIYLGVVPRSNYLWVATSAGVEAYRSVRRLMPSERYDK